MAKSEYRSAIRSRKLILSALADLLQEKSLDKITVTDIVNRADINRGTFYAHYKDIPDVLDHLIRQTFVRIQEGLSADQPLGNMATAMLLLIQEILQSDLEFYKKIMNSSASLILQERLVEIVLDYLLQREDEFGFGNHEQYLFTMRFCAGGLSNLYRDWFAGKLSCSLDELTRHANTLLTGTISQVV